MSARAPTIELNNGVQMPALGLGVYQSGPDETAPAVRKAIESGYRLVDTAAIYGNEAEVGEGIRTGGVDRSELFITTKLWISDYGYDAAMRAFDVSIGKLGLERLDLYLLHWPVPAAFDAAVESYRAAERLLAEGRVRAIGVCNFDPEHLEALVSRSQTVPAVNQVELHPFFNQRAVRDANSRHGVATQSWAPIGGTYVYEPKDPNAVVRLLEHPVVVEIAEAHGKTPAQAVLRWHVQHGLSAIQKSVTPRRIEQNIDVFDFELSTDEMSRLDALETGRRAGPAPSEYGAEFVKAAA